MNKEAHPILPDKERRRFLQMTALAAGSALLVACGGSTSAPPAKLTAVPTTDPKSVAATVTASVGKTYFPSGDPMVPDAFTAPLPPFQSVLVVPGRGGPVNVFGISYKPAPVAKDQNKYWQELEKRLNVKWNITLAPGAEAYVEKVSTLLASGNMGDLVLAMPDNAPALWQAFQQGAFTELTPYLSGSALKEYPNLAAIPEQIWKNARINGKIYGVPRPRPLLGDVVYYRKDWADKLGLGQPQNADDVYKMLKAFTRSGTWGMGFSLTPAFNALFMNMFGVPNGWRLESNGTLTYYIQTDEYRRAVDFMRRAWADRLFYPDSLSMQVLQTKQNFWAGKFGIYTDGIGALPQAVTQPQQANPDARVEILVPPGADGGKISHWRGPGFYGFMAIPSSVTDQERIKELLRVLNYFAAPVFSLEANFLSYGIDGRDNTVSSNGTRKLNDTGQKEVADLASVGNAPVVFYYPDVPDLGPAVQKAAKQLLSMGVDNPTLGYYSPTNASKQAGVLGKMVIDRVNRIVRGQDPLSALDTLISDWKKQGGDKVAQEYAQAMHK